jgi:hypothetical protein
LKIPLRKCQHRLAEIWLAGGGLIFVLILWQTLAGHYVTSDSNNYATDAWNWFLPAVLPTASLIVTALFHTSDSEQKDVDSFLFRLCVTLSLVYLFVLLSVVVTQPFQPTSAAEALKHSNIFLAPLQAIVAGAVAAFFGKAEKTETKTPPQMAAAESGT